MGHILIVDDSKTIRLFLRVILESAGYSDLVEIASAEELFSYLDVGDPTTKSPHVDLILLDIVMPGINGIEACRRLKATERFTDIPIIMVTAQTDDEPLKQAFAAGAMDYIAEPLREVELLVRVQAALRLKQEMERRKARERDLMESEERFRQLSDATFEGIAIRDKQQIVDANLALANLFGYTRSELEGLSILELFSAESHETLLEHDQQGFSKPFEATGVKKDGLHFPIEVLSKTLSYQGRTASVLAIRDLSERKRLEQLRDDLVRTMVHDLRNPLTGIYSTLKVLTRATEGLSSNQISMLDIASRSSQQMLELVNGILDISRLESGEMPLLRTPIHLGNLIDDTLSLQAPLANSRDVDLEKDVPVTLPSAMADAGLIERVLQNLVGNAIKFTPSRGEVRVRAFLDREIPTRIRVSVSDTGSGVPDEIRNKLFQRFVTGEQPGSGSGLGLAFCKMVLNAHGEELWLESTSEEGTTFTFTLPVAAEDAV